MVPLFEPFPPQYFIRVVSDRWIRAETVLPVSFRHLILPDRFPAATPLLDFQPEQLSSLAWPEVQNEYAKDFETFNPVQTQCFKSLYLTDQSVYIGAPTNTGKSVCAELAILRLLKQRITESFGIL